MTVIPIIFPKGVRMTIQNSTHSSRGRLRIKACKIPNTVAMMLNSLRNINPIFSANQTRCSRLGGNKYWDWVSSHFYSKARRVFITMIYSINEFKYAILNFLILLLLRYSLRNSFNSEVSFRLIISS